MTKQVKQDTAPNAPAQNLFISVKTFDGPTGKTIGERIVDMYHFGTNTWLQKHHWWAMHNGHQVETTVATPAEADSYVALAKVALAAKFNHSASNVAEPALVAAAA